jgi:hypothetical protein
MLKAKEKDVTKYERKSLAKLGNRVTSLCKTWAKGDLATLEAQGCTRNNLGTWECWIGPGDLPEFCIISGRLLLWSSSWCKEPAGTTGSESRETRELKLTN